MRTVSDLEITCFVSIDALRGVSSVSSLLLTWRAGFQEKNMETYMFERKMDNCKPCGGAIPLCMIDEFKLPEKIVDRKVIIRDLAVNDSTQGRSGCDKH